MIRITFPERSGISLSGFQFLLLFPPMASNCDEKWVGFDVLQSV